MFSQQTPSISLILFSHAESCDFFKLPLLIFNIFISCTHTVSLAILVLGVMGLLKLVSADLLLGWIGYVLV